MAVAGKLLRRHDRTARGTERPDKAFRRIEATGVEASGVELFLTLGMIEPDSLHLEVSRRGKVRAFWNGLAWVA